MKSKSELYQEALEKARDLIGRGYPVPTEDPEQLARIILESQKSINSNNEE